MASRRRTTTADIGPSEPPAPASEAPAAPDADRRARTIERAVLVGLLIFSALLVSLYVRSYPQLSPIDELQHVDYMIKASRGEMVRRGDSVGQDAMREEACRGVDGAGLALPSCDSARFDPAAFQEEGFNTAEIHPPTYYVSTGIVARALLPLLGGRGLVTAGRLVGALWLMSAVAALWFLLRAFGARVSTRTAVILLVVTAPGVLHSSATVNNDVTALVAGGALLLAAIKWQRRSLPGWVVVVVAMVGVSLKATNLIGAGVVVGYLLLQALAQRRSEDHPSMPHRDVRAHLIMAGGIIAGVAVSGLVWAVLHEVLATAPNLANPISRRLQSDSLTLSQVLTAANAGVIPLDGAHLAPFFGGAVIAVIMMMVRWLVIGATFGVAASSASGSRQEAVAVSAILAAATAGPFLMIVNFVSLDVVYSIPPRYMLSVLPAMAVAMAVFFKKPWVNAAGRVLAVLAALATLRALV